MSRTRPVETMVCDTLKEHPEGMTANDIRRATGIESVRMGKDTLPAILKRLNNRGHVYRMGYRDGKTVWGPR